MAENLKQAKERLEVETRVTFEKREQAKLDDKALLRKSVEIDESTKLADVIKKRREAEDNLTKNSKDQVKFLDRQIKKIEAKEKAGEKVDGRVLRGLRTQRDKKREDLATDLEATELQRRKTNLLEKTTPIIENQAAGMKDMADKLESFVKTLPGGQFLADALGITGLGDKLEKEVTEAMANHILKTGDATGALNVGFDKAKELLTGVRKQAVAFGKTLMAVLRANPFLALAAAAATLFVTIRNIRSMQRKFANELGISRDQVGALAIKTKAAEMSFKAIGLDGDKIKGSLKEIVSEFGSLENATVANAMNIEKFAQNAGVGSSEVIKLNKVFMDLTGSTFDAATDVSKIAVGLAKSAGVSTAKVIGDMSSNAADFARFSMEGAEGFARAAVEAARVGSSLSEIVKAADSLLQFETSIEASFKAQVLTGRQINTEKARQLALDGDIAGLTNEIQSIVGQVGDIESLNVLQRKSVADAIGISVSDLLKISRGEQVAATETVQDVLEEQIGITNKLLSTQNDKAAEFYATQQGTQEVSIATATY